MSHATGPPKKRQKVSGGAKARGASAKSTSTRKSGSQRRQPYRVKPQVQAKVLVADCLALARVFSKGAGRGIGGSDLRALAELGSERVVVDGLERRSSDKLANLSRDGHSVVSISEKSTHAGELGERLPFFGAGTTDSGCPRVPRRERAMAALLRERMSKGLNTVVAGQGWDSPEQGGHLLGWRGAVAVHLLSLAAEEDAWGPYLIVAPPSRLDQWDATLRVAAPALRVARLYNGMHSNTAAKILRLVPDRTLSAAAANSLDAAAAASAFASTVHDGRSSSSAPAASATSSSSSMASSSFTGATDRHSTSCPFASLTAASAIHVVLISTDTASSMSKRLRAKRFLYAVLDLDELVSFVDTEQQVESLLRYEEEAAAAAAAGGRNKAGEGSNWGENGRGGKGRSMATAMSWAEGDYYHALRRSQLSAAAEAVPLDANDTSSSSSSSSSSSGRSLPFPVPSTPEATAEQVSSKRDGEMDRKDVE